MAFNVEKKSLFCLLNPRPAADEQRSLFVLFFHLLESHGFHAILLKFKNKTAKLLGHFFLTSNLVHYFAWYQYTENYLNCSFKFITMKIIYYYYLVFKHLPFLQAKKSAKRVMRNKLRFKLVQLLKNLNSSFLWYSKTNEETQLYQQTWKRVSLIIDLTIVLNDRFPNYHSYWICTSYGLFSVLVIFDHDTCDLSSQTRDWTHTPCIGRQSPNHWPAREVPTLPS